jgi:hypothetical protein
MVISSVVDPHRLDTVSDADPHADPDLHPDADLYQRSKKCSAVQKIAEERVEIVGCKGKKSDEKQPMKIQSTALKTRKTVEMDHVRRRLSSSSNNVSNMRLDGAMGIPLQVQVQSIMIFI